MYRVVIFDVDGTLVNSNYAHARAWASALAESGHLVSLSTIRSCIGMGSDKLLPAVIGITADSSQGKAIASRRGEIFKALYLPRIRPTRGARRLLQQLSRHGLRIVVASSAEESELQALLLTAGATEFVEAIASEDDAERSKPDPDIVRAALKRSGCSADEAVMIGDTPYDIAAARQIGVSTIALRSGGWSDGALSNAMAIYDDPGDLADHFNEVFGGSDA